MNDVLSLTLGEASGALGMAPLEVLAWCTLEGLVSSEGLIDPGFIEVLRATGHAAVESYGDGEAAGGRPLALEDTSSDVPPDLRERRLWVLRRVAGKLQRSGKWWPASIDMRAIARGVPDVGLARNAVEALERAGLVRGSVKAGVHRVGLVGGRRGEIARLIQHGEVADGTLTKWIA